jgi:hypothetical protein
MNAGPNISSRLLNRWSLVIAGVVCALAGSALLGGCAGGGSSNRSGEFDPFGFPGDDSVVTAGVAGEMRQAPRTATATAPEVIPEQAIETKAVLRVQFFTTSNYREAEDVLHRAEGALDEPVVVEFDTPYYKILAGPLPTREAADKLVMRLRGMGYESAWVVREQVRAAPRK